jgi:hypothetical protein
MDPISTALVAALGTLTEPIVKDAYDALKSVLIQKFGGKSDVLTAVQQLEQKPDSPGRRETLQEELTGANAVSDAEILQLAQALLDTIQAQPGGPQAIQQTVTGDRNIFSGSGNVSVQFGPSGPRRPR